ncbi:MAG: UDP-2,3-diacylglucosamine diphosphatase LpxI, partial [Candidatus Omnitrophota bacterium]
WGLILLPTRYAALTVFIASWVRLRLRRRRGKNTLKNLIRAKAACLAIEAGKTLFIDEKESIKLADKKGISIVAV